MKTAYVAETGRKIVNRKIFYEIILIFNLINWKIMDYIRLLHSVPSDFKQMLRKLENVSLKIISKIWSTVFNKTCIKEGLMPKYLNFNLI